MTYKEMIEGAKAKGLASEKSMWQSVDSIDELLCVLKKEHPDMYWVFMRKQHGAIYNGHYSDEFAEYDVSMLMWKDKEGKKHEGAYWTKEQVKTVTAGKSFPTGTTECDKWVAYNVMYSDLCKELDNEEILKASYAFFFADDDFDYSCGSKIWKYTSALR